MPGRASSPILIPRSFWERAETISALRRREIGRLFGLLRQYAGASQTQIGIACGMNQGKVSEIMRGVAQVETLAVFERIADGLDMPAPARMTLGLAPRVASPSGEPVTLTVLPAEAGPASEPPGVCDLPSLDPVTRQEEDDPVRRRTFVGLTGASMIGALLGGTPADSPPFGASLLAPVLSMHDVDAVPESHCATPDIGMLSAAVGNARRQYQACQYADLIRHLPGLLAQLHTACSTLDGDFRLHAYALSADAHHVAAGLLLKLDDQGLAHLAADRSMRAAQASGDPVTIAASARIVTHALMSGGHLAAAASTARRCAAQLDRDVPSPDGEALSVYGSLLLRGAIAAAHDDRRSVADEFLTEAEAAGQRLGADANLRGTAFGPTNASLHRVSIAVTLGDAGTAIEVARGIDPGKIVITERKATLLIDTARAFLQWGKHEKAYHALRAADQVAHEEITSRPSVRRLVGELAAAAPPSLRPEAREFATQIGSAW